MIRTLKILTNEEIEIFFAKCCRQYENFDTKYTCIDFNLIQTLFFKTCSLV